MPQREPVFLGHLQAQPMRTTYEKLIIPHILDVFVVFLGLYFVFKVAFLFIRNSDE